METKSMRKLLYFFRQFGFDPLRSVSAIRFFPKFLSSWLKFLRINKFRSGWRLSPVLNDFSAQAGAADGHYFWQDLICAKWIHELTPKKHLDVGSRIDGFLAHLLSFRSVTLVDVRPFDLTIPGLTVAIGDAQSNLVDQIGTFDSVSSLHCIEHFGLGRYRDPLDKDGHIKGLKHISECIEEKGSLFISFPIGKEKVEFNEQRIIDPEWPVLHLKDFKLKEFVLIPWRGEPIFGLDPVDVDKKVIGQAGLYWFERN
jgi:hypothetical protein